MIGTPSIFKLTRKAAALTRVLPTFAFNELENAARRKWNTEAELLKLQKSGQFPDEPVRIKVGQSFPMSL